MIGELRKKVQQLEISLSKERREGGLLDALYSAGEENVQAATLLQLLHFVFSRRNEIDE